MTVKKQKTVHKKHTRSVSTTAAKRGRESIFESDSTYFLKLVVFVLLGTLWLKFAQPVTWLGMPVSGVPLGFVAGLVLVRQFEKHQADRKIWYAILVVVTIICYFVPAGIVI